MRLRFTGLFDRYPNFGRSTKIIAPYSDVDANGSNSAVDGKFEPHGTVDDVTEHHAKREHNEHDVDERYGNGGLSRYGLDGNVNVSRELSRGFGIGWLSFVVTLGPNKSNQKESGKNLKNNHNKHHDRLFSTTTYRSFENRFI